MKNTNQNLPDGWSNEKIVNIATVLNGSTPKKGDSSYWDSGTIPWFTIDDIRAQGRIITNTIQKITEKALSETSVKLIPENSTLLCCTASVGECAFTKIKLTTNQQFNALVPKEDKVDSLFLYYVSSSLSKELNNLSGTTTFGYVSIGKLQQINLLLPPLPQQKKIAQILSTVDNAINKTDEIIKQAELLKKGLMQDLFTKGIGHKKFKQTKLGMIPEEWEVVTMKDSTIQLIDGDRGTNYPKLSDFSDDGYCLFLNTGNLKGNRFNFENCNFITQEKDEQLRKGKLNRHDLVLTTRGTVGNITYYSDNIQYKNIRINSGMLIIRGGEQFDQEYLYYLLQSPYIVTLFKSASSGSAQPQLPIRTLNLISIPTPDIPEQKQIVKVLLSADKKIELVKNQRKQLLGLKNGLMQDLLTGRRLVN